MFAAWCLCRHRVVIKWLLKYANPGRKIQCKLFVYPSPIFPQGHQLLTFGKSPECAQQLCPHCVCWGLLQSEQHFPAGRGIRIIKPEMPPIPTGQEAFIWNRPNACFICLSANSYFLCWKKQTRKLSKRAHNRWLFYLKFRCLRTES